MPFGQLENERCRRHVIARAQPEAISIGGTGVPPVYCNDGQDARRHRRWERFVVSLLAMTMARARPQTRRRNDASTTRPRFAELRQQFFFGNGIDHGGNVEGRAVRIFPQLGKNISGSDHFLDAAVGGVSMRSAVGVGSR